MTELLPCPFCGSPNVISRQEPDFSDHPNGGGWHIECLACPAELGIYMSEKAAARAWNNRPTTESEKAKAK